MTKYITLSRKAKDLAGQVFGRLVALGPVGQRPNTEILWQCLCDCHTLIVARGGLLGRGVVRSCGCLASEGVAARNHRHGLYGTVVYRAWQGMKTRCSPNIEGNKHFAHYAGRGISVCAEWANSFMVFYDHVSALEYFGEKGYTLDRIDVNGNYAPGNVRWATNQEQGRNKRNNVILTFAGKTQSLAAWSEELCIHPATLHYRLNHGWSVERTLSTPANS